ncbi:MAG: HlyD family secretion protein [Verrucomicrobiaceae bacterium]|nr:HlyD family secretion protein [Verrucomicrobiaceae bacterium]
MIDETMQMQPLQRRSKKAKYKYKYQYKYGEEYAQADVQKKIIAPATDNRFEEDTEESAQKQKTIAQEKQSTETQQRGDVQHENNEQTQEKKQQTKKDDAESESDDSDEDDEEGMSPQRRRIILFGIAAVFVIGAIVWLLLWFFVFSQRVKTDDAYIGGNQVMVSAKVAGTIIEIGADETQRVVAGQVVARLDPVDATASFKRAQANLAQAVRQVRQQNANADQSNALVASRRVDLQRAGADLQRREPLLQDQAIAPEEVAHAREQYQAAQTALTQAEQQALAARALVDGTDIENNPTVQQAMAAFRDAWVNNSRNAIVAPINGYIAQRQVQLGQTVQPGQNLFTIVPLDSLWVDANFKESQLQHIRIGQSAEVTPDIYHGDVVFHGRVLGLAPGTGGAFALLPPQNASGNWIKVVQRLPVRIALDPAELRQHPLRIGLSTKTLIDTHERDGTVLPDKPAQKPMAQTRVYERELRDADSAAKLIVLRNLGPVAPAATRGKSTNK